MAKPLPNMKLPLESRLRALQAESRFASGARRILSGGPEAKPLTALLCEVNETILARNLHIETGNGASLAMDVAGRRILRITSATGVEGSEPCMTAPVLEDAHRDELCRLLQRFCQTSPELQVVTGPMTRDGEGMTVGVPVSRLAEHLSIDLNPAEAEQSNAMEPEPQSDGSGGFLAKFSVQTGARLIAWLIHSDNDADQTGIMQAGPEDMVLHLRGFLDDERPALMAQLDRVTRGPDQPVCIVLGADLQQGHSLLCVRANGGLLLGVISGEAAGSVLQAWNAARQ